MSSVHYTLCILRSHWCIFALTLYFVSAAQHSHAQAYTRHGNMVNYRGNTFEIGALTDTSDITDSGIVYTQIRYYDTAAVKMNGQYTLLSSQVASEPVPYENSETPEIQVLKGLVQQMSKLSDGVYFFTHGWTITVDEKGNAVFYFIQEVKGYKLTPDGHRGAQDDKDMIKLTKAQRTSIDMNMAVLIAGLPRMKPAMAKNGTPVIFNLYCGYNHRFEVKKHIATLKKGGIYDKY